MRTMVTRQDAADLLRFARIVKADGSHFDANETAVFARQLEYVLKTVFEVKYPDLLARTLIPVNTEIPSGAEYFVTRSYDWAGMAKILANYADDLPRVDILGKEEVQPIRSIGDSYGYSLQDTRNAILTGVNLESARGKAARRAIENLIDQIAAVGDTKAGLRGMLNNANVPILDSSDITGDWLNVATTPAQILADLNKIVNSVVTTTKNAHKPDTLLLPVSHYSYLATTPFNTADVSKSILRVFLENSPYIRNIDQWQYLDLGDAAGTGPRAVAYARNSEVLELIIPQDFEQLPPQPRMLAWDVPCHARVGGVAVRYPLAMVYADDI